MGCVANRKVPQVFTISKENQTIHRGKSSCAQIPEPTYEKVIDNENCSTGDDAKGNDEYEIKMVRKEKGKEIRSLIIPQAYEEEMPATISKRSSLEENAGDDQEEDSRVIQELLTDSSLEGIIREENNFSTIMIYNSKIFMEFTLPKCKAGPLIVPFINYSPYRL